MRANTIVLLQNGQKTGDMTGALTFGPEKLAQIYGYGIQANFSGSPAGTLKIQASIDGVGWSDIPGSSFTVTGAGSFLWNVTSSNYLYVQMIWTPTSGSGTLSALAYIRGF